MGTMFLQISRSLLVFALCLVLGACGARSTNEYGVDEATAILLVGDRLTGLRVEIGSWHDQIVTSEDVSRRLGTWTASRNQEEKKQRVLIEVAPGKHVVNVYNDGGLILSKDLYLSAGQKLELKVAVPAQ